MSEYVYPAKQIYLYESKNVRTRKCYHCQKPFRPTADIELYHWRLFYNGADHYYCSYTCFRHDEKILLESGKKIGKRMTK